MPIQMTFGDESGEDVLVVLCTYTLAKEKVKAKITGFEGKAKEKAKERIPLGTAFSFTWVVKGDTATLDNLTGDEAEHLRPHLEGMYEQKK